MSEKLDSEDTSSVTSGVTEDSVEKQEDAETIAVSAPTDSFDTLARELKALRETVSKADERKQDNKRLSEDREVIEKMNAEISSLRTELDKQNFAQVSRKAEFQVSEDDAPAYTTKQFDRIMGVKAAVGSEFEQVQRANDELYVASTLLGIKNPMHSSVLKNYTQELYPDMYKAMEIQTATQGPEWIPTGFSNQMVEDVRVQLRVAALHSRFDMPTNPFTIPVEGADISAYKVAENTGDDDAGTVNTWVPAATPKTGNVTFNTKKLGVRVVASNEITEDSIVAVLPYIRDKIAISLAEAQENGCINGDVRLSGAIDGITVDTNQETAYDGYRVAAQTLGTTTDLSTINVETIRKMRAGMGRFGINTSRLAYVVGINGYNNLLSLKDSGDNNVVMTLDKIGPRATLLTGQLGSLDGIPIIVSEFVSETLDAVGENSGSSTLTELLLVRTDAFRFGDRRPITLKSREVIETDQQVLVALQRLDFEAIYKPSIAANTIAAAGVNIALI